MRSAILYFDENGNVFGLRVLAMSEDDQRIVQAALEGVGIQVKKPARAGERASG